MTAATDLQAIGNQILLIAKPAKHLPDEVLEDEAISAPSQPTTAQTGDTTLNTERPKQLSTKKLVALMRRTDKWICGLTGVGWKTNEIVHIVNARRGKKRRKEKEWVEKLLQAILDLRKEWTLDDLSNLFYLTIHVHRCWDVYGAFALLHTLATLKTILSLLQIANNAWQDLVTLTGQAGSRPLSFVYSALTPHPAHQIIPLYPSVLASPAIPFVIPPTAPSNAMLIDDSQPSSTITQTAILELDPTKPSQLQVRTSPTSAQPVPPLHFAQRPASDLTPPVNPLLLVLNAVDKVLAYEEKGGTFEHLSLDQVESIEVLKQIAQAIWWQPGLPNGTLAWGGIEGLVALKGSSSTADLQAPLPFRPLSSSVLSRPPDQERPITSRQPPSASAAFAPSTSSFDVSAYVREKMGWPPELRGDLDEAGFFCGGEEGFSSGGEEVEDASTEDDDDDDEDNSGEEHEDGLNDQEKEILRAVVTSADVTPEKRMKAFAGLTSRSGYIPTLH